MEHLVTCRERLDLNETTYFMRMKRQSRVFAVSRVDGIG